MTAKEHRVALIGAGRIAAVHLGYARGVPATRVVAVCDADPQRAEEFARARNVPAHFTDVDEMMRRCEPNIVHVVTPPATHAKLAIAAMRGGANVLVEKPMAMTVAEAERMCEVAREHGRRLCVDHNRLFDPVVLRARRLVADGTLGEIVSVEAHQGVNLVEEAGPASGAKHWSVEDRFAPLYNLGPHPLYLVDELIGPFDDIEVRGRTASGDAAVLSEIRVVLGGPRGFGYVAFSMGAQPYLNHLTIYGTRATLRINLNTMTLLLERVRRLPKLVAKLAANLEPAGQMLGATAGNVLAVATRRMKLYPGIGENIRRFYRSLDEGDPPPVSADRGIAVVKMLNAIQARLERDLGSSPGLGSRAPAPGAGAEQSSTAGGSAAPAPPASSAAGSGKDASWTS
jgi:predicted dehydrogenase